MRRVLALFAATIMLLCIFPLPAEAAEPLDQDTLFGTVFGDDGTPMRNVTIEARNVTSGMTYIARSNETGVYELEVPYGSYNISASYQNYSANRTYVNISVPLALGPYNFTMTEVLGTVSGYVTDDDVPVFNVVITISNEMYNYTGTSVQPFGRYEITGIQPGIYVAYAEKRGYDQSNYLAPIVVARGSAVSINFTLEEQPASLVGTIDMDNNDPLDEVKVTLSSNDGIATMYTFTDSNGNYSFTGLSAGTYTVTFEKDGFETETRTMTFDPYDDRRIDLTLTRVEVEGAEVLFGYDLAHSLMIIALGVGIAIVLLGVIINFITNKKPELLSQMEKDDEKKED
ncbi:MAG: carboxypeptidase regulatory-like domain-containing protein [Euryarchaeota archaeon]|nr:carboxypeptidase regulatory-like domain-containing protein [Euryarchaeota archaeon]